VQAKTLARRDFLHHQVEPAPRTGGDKLLPQEALTLDRSGDDRTGKAECVWQEASRSGQVAVRPTRHPGSYRLTDETLTSMATTLRCLSISAGVYGPTTRQRALIG